MFYVIVDEQETTAAEQEEKWGGGRFERWDMKGNEKLMKEETEVVPCNGALRWCPGHSHGVYRDDRHPIKELALGNNYWVSIRRDWTRSSTSLCATMGEEGKRRR